MRPPVDVGESERAVDARAPRAGTRVAALDGLRGVVIVMVVLNHAVGKLWPRGEVYDIPVLSGFLTGGAVTVFFVVGAFIVTRNLTKELAQQRMDAVRFYTRRLIRIGVMVVPLCVFLVLLHLFDDSYRGTTRNLVENITHLLTYTFNLWGETDLLGTRPELGHLWYLSVQQQAYLVLPLVLLLFVRWPRALAGALVICCLVCFWWRQVVFDQDGWIVATTLTSTRVDAVLWGVVAAVVLPLIPRGTWWARVLWISAATLLALKLVLPELSPVAFLGVWSVAFMVVAAVLVAAIWSVEAPTRVTRLLSIAPLSRLGKASLALYVWHLPVFVFIARHTEGWAWPARAVVGLLVLGLVVVVLERLVEEPTRRFLATSRALRLPSPASATGRSEQPTGGGA